MDQKKTSIYSHFKTDKSKEREGEWVEYRGGVQLLIARSGGANSRFSHVFERRSEPHQRKLRTGEKLGEETASRLLAETYAETVVLGWRTRDLETNVIENDIVYGEDGEPIRYSFEAVVKLLTDLPDFFAQVREDAGNFATFKQIQREADAKN